MAAGIAGRAFFPGPCSGSTGLAMETPMLKRLRTSARAGVATIEAALLLNVLVLLLAGVLEFGRVLDVWVITRNAAREGARIGATGGTATEVRGRVLTYLNTS